ncbi:FbpB family small basic protein [Halalkalibacterium halodurans]|jgi:hypothetical protein|uniref:BH0880 protein n=1 Tax=Halalkalibacterium halodurans (strain ATCC BAA-125 / DSM 18197 / FERM 7344 / JCM 9153 / C-125) TaxID=272558 RepID=Q9KEH2_HALH5|nr:FbpB family small basic protein [Halalkalibacterium halodurans]MDY7221378.1 FbpB family small basic protein [Halalkalibacterium halodurans]MDY7240617.1 FbpB family small basic protein [Halalkalibacterium halodurans]MED3646381.1 FbpB family small basic protein [Halalkalibacterium halodurans]MED4080757.1 FbpB family small basic protein [Halalkalibacterium halodurans]MED4086214.1 FbpB family small basic protein [Halalkalibacterium halodurans]
MGRKLLSFEELVLENKKELLNDPEQLSKIEKRLDEKQAQAQKTIKKAN